MRPLRLQSGGSPADKRLVWVGADASGHMVALPRDQHTAFVANITAGTLSIVDLVGNAEPVVIAVGSQTEGIGVSHDGREVDSLQTAGIPYRLAFTPNDSLVLITNPEQDEILLVEVATRAVRPWKDTSRGKNRICHARSRRDSGAGSNP